MSNECCKEFSGWCRAFTRVERALVVLEAILLVLLLALLVFVTLHMIVCSSPMTYIVDNTVIATEGVHADSTTVFRSVSADSTTVFRSVFADSTTVSRSVSTDSRTDAATITTPDIHMTYQKSTTIDPKVTCTWEPSVKTKAVTHYYYSDGDKQTPTAIAAHTVSATTTSAHTTSAQTISAYTMSAHTMPTPLDEYYLDPEVEILNPNEFVQSDASDGEEVNDDMKSFVIALVKMKPPTDITFGCILTIISEYWVLTAASCIEAIEELDSLDSFVMMEEYGSPKNGQIHTISDLQVHPFYQETNKSYDIAALRSDDSLLRRDKRPVEVVSFVEDALLAIGERFHLLGYGAFRSIESGRRGRRLRVAYVYTVAARLCEATRGAGAGALRHLAGGRRAGPGHAPASRRRLCAGVLSARGLPCNYCAGAPLLLPDSGRLLALMMDSPQCGVACDPNLYLPLVLVLDWIEHVLEQ